MTIVNFSNARFTPQDMRLFYTVACENFTCGSWQAILRSTSDQCDQITVLSENNQTFLLMFLRDFKGIYKLYQFINDRPFLVGFGDSAETCLRALVPFKAYHIVANRNGFSKSCKGRYQSEG